jgi:hypothetical protein
MTPASLLKLVKSLSSSEKRYFKLQSKLQNGSKEYLLLFNLLDENNNNDEEQLKAEFKKRSPAGSWDNTCVYLANMLIESLVRAKRPKDVFFDLLHQIQEVKVLSERSLDDEAFKKIKKIRRKAADFQLHLIEYYCHRFELNYYSDNNFPGLHDDSLIKLQMKGKDVLKNINHIHDHYSLYELLKFRLIRSGKIVSEEGKKKLNDLVLSEMVLITGKAKSFLSQKLHMLFQSFFFTDIGDYESALKSFYKLNELMEENELLLDNPPIDYLSALTGIVDSLRMLKNDSDVSLYLSKISSLDQHRFPEYFRYLVRKTFCTQQIVTFINSGEHVKAKEFIDAIPADVFEEYTMIDEEKQCELYFFCSLVHFFNNDWRKAHLFIRRIMNELKLPEQSLVSKAIRLLNIIIYYKKQELLHLEYEIRSYKRYFGHTKLLKIEKVLFKVITSFATDSRLYVLHKEQRKVINELDDLINNRYEQQLLKYFDFAAWIRTLIETKTKRIKGGELTAG